MDHQYVNDERPPKRTRQACEPCRRKKAKCTGEKPACSTCGRLRQRCFYAAEPKTSSASESYEPPADLPGSVSRISRTEQELHNRIESLEFSLAEVLQNLRNSSQSQQSLDSSNTQYLSSELANVSASRLVPHQPSTSSPLLMVALPPWPTVLALVDDYLKYCDSQPLPLFHRETLRTSFPDRDPEIVFSFLALMIRFSNDIWLRRNVAHESARYLQAAHKLVMECLSEGRVELPTIQALCLLSQTEFYDGDYVKSRLHSSLAMTLATSANLHRKASWPLDSIASEERSRCYWSIVLLRRLLGEDLFPLESHRKMLPSYPQSPCVPPAAAVSPEGQRIASLPRPRSDGIIATVIQLSEVWSATQGYVSARGMSEPPLPPWSPHSKYSSTLQRLMDLSQGLPPLHRYRCIKLSSVTAEDLEDARDYWAPWFLSRFLYHTIICILNHPLLITLQLQGVLNVSEVFVQQTAFSISHHTTWILHFIDFLGSRRFRVTDPIFGYCVVVVATIELQQSFSEEGDIAKRKKDNYKKCLSFIDQLGKEWKLMEQLAKKLDKLADLASKSHKFDVHGADEKLRIDVSGFLDVLDLANSCKIGIDSSQYNTVFGPTLQCNPLPEPVDTTSLIRLPSITAMDVAVPSDPMRSDRGARHGSATSVAPVAYPQSEDAMMPMIDFFNTGQLANENWWNDTFGDMGDSV